MSSYRLALAGLAFLFAAFGGVVGGWTSRLPKIKAAIGLSDGDLAIALFASGVGAVIGTWASADLLRRATLRQIGWQCALLFWAVLVGFAAAPPLYALCGLMLAYGLCTGVFDVVLNVHAARLESERGTNIMSRLHGMFSLGLAASAGISVFAEHNGLSLQQHLLFFGGGIFGLILLGIALVNTRADICLSPPKIGAGKPVRWSIFLITLTAMSLCAFLAEGVSADWSALLVADVRAGGGAAGALALTIFGAGMTVSRFAGDSLAQRFGRPRLLIMSAVISGGGLALAAGADGANLTTVGFGIAALGLGPLIPNLLGLVAQSAAGGEVAIARVAGASYVAFLFGPALGGWGAKYVGLPAVFGLCAGLLALSAVTMWALASRFSVDVKVAKVPEGA
jgi:predicted MFS family arabinose efflux permease